jgi:glycosyltransferase involved in cell wall biosynthesis
MQAHQLSRGRGSEQSNIRVLHVISAIQLGGAEHLAINLAVQQAAWGLRPAVAAVRNPQSLDDAVGQHFREILQVHRIPLFELGNSGFRTDLLKLPFRLSKLIDLWSPDLVHSHTDGPDFVVSAARRRRKFRIVRTIHSTALWATHPLAGFLAEQGLRNDLIIGVSQDALTSYRHLRRQYGLNPSSHQRVISGGIRVRSWSELEPIKKRYCRGARLRVAFFGRSDPAKGLDVLLKALLSQSGNEKAPLELFIFSDAVQDQEFRSQAARLPYPLHLSPPVRNAAERMAEFDLVIIPSRVEGLCLVALEAFAAGTPIIATQIPGLREAVPPGWPLLVPPDNPEALMNMLLSVAHGNFDLVKLGGIGHKYIHKYALEIVAQEYFKSYLEYIR